MTGTRSSRHRDAFVTWPFTLPTPIFPVPLTIDAPLPWSIPHVQRRDSGNIDWLGVTRQCPRGVWPGRSIVAKSRKVYAWTAIEHWKGRSTIIGVGAFDWRGKFNCSSRICRVSGERVIGHILVSGSGLTHDYRIERGRVYGVAYWRWKRSE
jgi:hypothetical protein